MKRVTYLKDLVAIDVPVVFAVVHKLSQDGHLAADARRRKLERVVEAAVGLVLLLVERELLCLRVDKALKERVRSCGK